jgi:cyclohexyl-isocyanide hydratase
MAIHIGLLVFPGVQHLDLAGPYEVFSALPGVKVHLVWKDMAAVKASNGLSLTPDATFESAPKLDVICIPGGGGVGDLMEDEVVLSYIRLQAADARFVTSVCTGALVLGAAGLLRGRRATTHWGSHALLAPLGAIPIRDRVVRDGNLLTGGGVTAGIDFALTLAGELVGLEEAQAIQLNLEYAPAPPFNAGDPNTAPDAVVALACQRAAATVSKRTAIVARVAARL